MSRLRDRSEFLTQSADETYDLGRKLGKELPSHALIALYGDLGVGKTTFMKGLVESASGLSSHEVSSPTFNYLNIYSGKQTLYHFDLYRLKNGDEFFLMGFDEYFSLPGICCIEWPEVIAARLPACLSIHFDYRGENERRITVEGAC